jgi:hypothetical protein
MASPRWILARFPSSCSKCLARIAKGERVFYYPSGRSVMCAGENCGSQASRDYDAACFDEMSAGTYSHFGCTW